jgi:hypothetical protein
MKLVPLLGRSGHVKAWGDRETGWISDLTGKFFALVAFDGVFDRTGAQIGWWVAILFKMGTLMWSCIDRTQEYKS